MALMQCPECGNMVSSMADACPKCGCPVSNFTTNIGTEEPFSEVLPQYISENATEIPITETAKQQIQSTEPPVEQTASIRLLALFLMIAIIVIILISLLNNY